MRIDCSLPLEPAEFFAAVWRRVNELVASARLDAGQRDLLSATLRYHAERMGSHPLGNPLLFFALVSRAEGVSRCERVEWLGAFCLYYIMALDLLDDVQDEDLADKPHADAGAAVAINSGMTLFALALAALHRAMALESEPARALAYLGCSRAFASTPRSGSI